MSQASGFLTQAGLIGLESVLIKPQRGMKDFILQKGVKLALPSSIVAQATVEEVEHDELEIVEHPVEQGSMISDHAFKRPAEVMLRYGFSNSAGAAGLAQGLGAAIGGTANIPQSLMAGNAQSGCAALYDLLVAIQANRVLFTLYTGKRKHQSMMIKSLTNPTNSQTENSLVITIVCRQMIFAVTKVVTIGQTTADVQIDPQKTAPITDRGDVSLGEAPNVQSAMDSVTGPVSNAIQSVNAAAATGSAALESSVQTAIGQLETAATAAGAKLPGIMNDLATAATDAAASFTGAAAGAAGQLPGIATQVTADLTEALSTVGKPFEIPLITAPQSFTITLGAQVAP